MRKIIINIICILLLSSIIVSADIDNSSSIDLKPKLDTNAGKYGYIDKSGNWIITPSFQEASEFSDGLALVRCFDENDSQVTYTGYIDSKGELAFDKKFVSGYSFKNGYAVVTDKDEKVSLIDKRGNVVLETDYYYYGSNSTVTGIHTEISDMPTGRSGISPKVGYITDDLKLIKPMFSGGPSYYILDDSEESFPQVPYSEYDSSGKELKFVRYLINTKMEPVEMPSGFVSSIKDGMILIDGDNGFAFMNMDGEIFDEIYSSQTGQKHKFVRAESFSEGHAVVGVEDVLSDPYGDPVTAYGYINKDGSTFKEPEYLSANSFSEGLAAVQPYPSHALSMSILKTNGEYLLPPQTRQEIAYSENEEDYFATGLYTQEEYDFVKSEVKRIVSEVTGKNMSDLEKLAAIHKYVIDHGNYSLIQAKDPTPLGLRYMFEAIGILKGRTVVCDGYTKLLGLLLNEAGIENMYVSGEAAPGGGERYIPHSWNLVKIGEKYYHIDATWDDDEGPNKYYLVSDKYMKESRRWEYSDYPAVSKGYYDDTWQSKK